MEYLYDKLDGRVKKKKIVRDKKYNYGVILEEASSRLLII